MQHVYVAIAAALLGWGLTGIVLIAARKSLLLAMPTDRGLHKMPTPVGGGIGLIGATLAVWAIGQWPLNALAIVIVAAVAALAGLSWLDDRQPLPAIVRFAAQTLIVCTALWNLPHDVRLIYAMPLGLERAALAFAWLWMINLTNFMDGIDGLAGTEAITIGVGYALVTELAPGMKPLGTGLPALALILAGAAAGYLYWNWDPARIFMGDVGSIPLGFLIGLLMFDLLLRGHWAAACILPAYFIADATTTLLWRVARGVKPWDPHREHAYQHAVLAGLTHAQVACHVAVLNISLIALAVLSLAEPWLGVACAAALTAALIAWLRTRSAPAK